MYQLSAAVGVRILLPLILTVAATLKYVQLYESWLILSGRFWGFVELGVIDAELCLALWLLSGFKLRYAKCVAIVCVLTFLGVHVFSLVSGYDACGCFGEIKVNPIFMLTLNGVMFGLLLLFNSNTTHHLNLLGGWARIFAIIFSLIALVVANRLLFARSSERTISTDKDARVAVLSADQLVGKRFSLSEDIDVGSSIMSGKWIVILYHSDCSTCQQALPRYIALSPALSKEVPATRIALIEMPPYAMSRSLPKQSSMLVMEGRLKDSKEWFAQTPLAITLTDGKVVSAKEGTDAIP